MSEITIATLEPELRQHAEGARTALDRGRPEQALELCGRVLAVYPDCLQVRKLERAAQLKFAAVRRGLVAKWVQAVSTAPFLFGGNLKLKDDPRAALATAERLLRRDPQSVPALQLLGQAATQLGWNETAIFSYQTASDLEPERIDLLILLGDACLTSGRVGEAITAAQQAIQLDPHHPEAQRLQQFALGTASRDGRSLSSS